MDINIDEFKSDYSIKKIYLQETKFFRDEIFSGTNDFSINLKIEANKDLLTLKLSVKVESLSHPEQFNIVVTFIGLFELLNENTKLETDTFLRMNAPAIMYPYIRQHIRSLSLDAGMSGIIIPTVNFKALYSRKTGEEE